MPGALAIGHLDPHRLPLLGAVLIVGGLPLAELAHRLIRGRAASAVEPAASPAALPARGGAA